MVLLISTASATLGLALLAASNAPFQHAFAASTARDVTVTANPAHAGAAQLAATRIARRGHRDGRAVRRAATVPAQFDGPAVRAAHPGRAGLARAARSTTWC